MTEHTPPTRKIHEIEQIFKSNIASQHFESLSDQEIERRRALKSLHELGIDPYPYKFDRTHTSAEAIALFSESDPDAKPDASVAGRIMAIRRMGKATFIHIQDEIGKIQLYVKADEQAEKYEIVKLLDIGDILGAHGFIFRTRTGEVSLHIRSFELLAKAIHPLPVVKEEIDEKTGEKIIHDAFSDKELRYRRRYIDLIVNPHIRETFRKRSLIISTIRRFFDERGYLEVETPVLQPIYGGAYARPFITHHNALNFDLYLRIADELYLKRLIVGGLAEGVYEIAKDFRNEGMDKNHSPEFTMAELYVAYKDYHWMMDLVEEMFAHIARVVSDGGMKITQKNGTVIDFTPPYRRLTMFDSIKEYAGIDISTMSEKEMFAAAKNIGVDLELNASEGKIIDEIFSQKVEHLLIQPTFITDYPKVMSPLAKAHRSKAGLVERFELMVNGQELANCFSELNDPIDQRIRFEEQARLRAGGDEEAMALDEDFLRSLEIGMPPTAGLGFGVDRLTMIMTGEESIRDVVLFPAMRPER